MCEDIKVGDKFIYNGSFRMMYSDFTVGEVYEVSSKSTNYVEFVNDVGDLVSWTYYLEGCKDIFTSLKDDGYEVGDYIGYGLMSENDFISQIDYALDEKDEELFNTLTKEAKKRGFLK